MPRNWAWGKKRKSGFRSGFEEQVAKTLTDKGIGWNYESLVLSYEKPVRKAHCQACGSNKVTATRHYRPDFILENGTIIEVKGRLTQADRTKLLLVKNNSPEIKIVLLFGADNKIRKTSEKRYSDWATEHGFDFSIRSIPRRWFVSRRQSKDHDRKQEVTS